MKQVIIEMDEGLATQLERVAPSRSRKRSEFIRAAIRKALWELEESATKAAYVREPQNPEDDYGDAREWDDMAQSTKPSARRQKA